MRTPGYVILAALLTFVSAHSLWNAQAADTSTPVRALVITGTHGYDKPQFNAMFGGLPGLDCTVKEAGKNPGVFFDQIDSWPYDVIVLYNYGQELSEAHRKNFIALLHRGVGLVALHHSIAGFPGWLEYEKIIGATYPLNEETRDGVKLARPTYKHGVTMRIHVEDPAHPILTGLGDFEIHDESYKGWVYHEGSHLLLTTDHADSNRQIAWTRTYGKARVFYLELGHDKLAYEKAQYQRLIRQGVLWAAARP
jgi:uncharacterized protein